MSDERIKHAKSYPFHIPETSYVLDQDGWRPFEKDIASTHRHVVIASGSNASPDRLAAKFKNHADLLAEPIYVTRAALHDFDTVYSAHFTNYGSIPATLSYALGLKTHVFVTWLTDAQLDRMHETESVGENYNYARLSDIHLAIETGEVHSSAHAYISTRGCLNKSGAPVSLSAMTQPEILDYAKSIVAPSQGDTDDFIRTNLDCDATRTKHTQRLAQTALAMGWPKLKILR